MMTVERINLPALGLPVGPYSHAVRHENQLHTSGFTAFGSDAQSGPIADQAAAIFDQLELLAQSQGSTLDKLIKVTIFATDFSEIAALRDYLEIRYGTAKPASALLKVDALFAPELKIEIEALFAL